MRSIKGSRGKEEPEYWDGIWHEGVRDGTVPGLWLLSYSRGLTYELAVFESQEAAVAAAAKIDQFTGKKHNWHINSVFIGEKQTTEELLELLGEL